MAIDEEKPLHIVMFPWLAFGHMIPNLELAKLIAQKGHKVSFISTPRNIQRLPKLSPLINFVELPLPKQPILPENAEATSDVPYDVVPHLKQAYDKLQQPLTHFLESSNVDWIFYDFIPYWVAPIASKLGIKCAFYSIFTPSFMGFIGPASPIVRNEPLRTKPEDFTVPPPWVPFPSTVAFRYFEIMKISDILSDNDSGVSDLYRWGASLEHSDIVVIRGCTKFEPQWFPVLDNIIQKPILPVGQLPTTKFEAVEDNNNDTWLWMKEWLDKQEHSTVVYVAFGSEAKPTQEEVNEIALGLEKSKLPFFWALKDRRGPTDTAVLRLPEGFEERTKEQGVVCIKWVPQMKILGHVAVGGFLSHSGWSSVVEAVQNEKPLILLTYLSDQGINARVLEEKKMGYSIPRDERNGSFTSDFVAHSIRLVMVEKEGRIYREKIKEMKDLFVNTERQESDDEYMTASSSPRGVFEVPISGTDSDSPGSINYSNNGSQGQRQNGAKGEAYGSQQWRSMIDALRFKSVRRFSTIPLLTASYEISRRNIRNKLARVRTDDDENDLGSALDLGGIPTKPSWTNFSYTDLVAATDDFNPENMIGKGGHAEVYKGTLPDGQVVAVKRLMKDEKTVEDRAGEAGDFLSELGIIAHINHSNATRLIGFGIDRGLYFVLQFAPHGSLASLLFGSECLEWKIRFKVAIGVAKGLQYLHHDCPRRIIHRDIKASNILLNSNDEAEISDFGLAKWLPDKWAHHVVFPIEGTFGYLAPEYFMHGLVDEKTDVFAFGVLLLELITGRRAVDSNSRQSLVIWAKPLLDSMQVEEIADPRLEDKYDPIEMKLTMATASRCVHHMPSKRPYMDQVVKILKGEEVVVDLSQKSIAPRSLLLDACDLEDYTCSNYLNDLDRHKQLLMEI